MPDPRSQAGTSRRFTDRAIAAMRHTEGHDLARYNGADPRRSHDQRGERHVFPIQVTDQPDPATPYLWPAVVRYWSGYAAGVHSFEDWPDDSVVDIWAFVMPTSAALETDGEYLGVFVGIHTDGYAVFEVAAGGGGSSPCVGTAFSFNFLTNQCVDVYGATTNEYRTLSVSADGCLSVGPKWCEAAPACCDTAGDDDVSAVPCCPGVTLKKTLYATVSGRGTFPLVYTGSYWRIDANWPDCAGGGFGGDWNLYLQCADLIGPDPTPDTWTINGNGFSNQPPDEISCDPFRLVFLDVPVMIGGGPCAANLYDVVIEL